jgi:hypothetical protein
MKGIGKMGVILIVGIVAIGIFMSMFGVFGNIYAIIVGPESCIISHAFNCFCGSDQEKVRVNTIPWSYDCGPPIQPEPYSFPMGVDDPNFNSMALKFAQDQIREGFPSCTTVQCESPMWKDIYPMSSISGNKGYVECLEGTDPLTSKSLWRVVFFTEDGTLSQTAPPYCNE